MKIRPSPEIARTMERFDGNVGTVVAAVAVVAIVVMTVAVLRSVK